MTADLTKIENARAHMEAAMSEDDWNRRCDEVKSANGGNYPREWYAGIVLSGVLAAAKARWSR